jgi:hypothetical protein
MSQPTIQVTIVDAAGVQRTFAVGHVDLDCGSGCIDIRPGKPAFCRGFEHGVLNLDDGDSVTTVNITRGMASLTGNAVNVICERATTGHEDWGEHPMLPAGSSDDGEQATAPPLSPSANPIPAQPTEANKNKPQANYSI